MMATMTPQLQGPSTVEARIAVPAATAEIVRIDMAQPVNHHIFSGPEYRLDMSFAPRQGNPRLQYCDRWQPQRYERVGNLFLLCGNEQIHGISDPNKGAAVACNLRPDALTEWFDDAVRWTDHQLVAALDIQDQSIRTPMLRLAEELRNPGFASETMVELIAAQLALELYRYCSAVRHEPAAGGLAPWQIRRIDERLDADLSPISLTDLAQLCRISTRQLTRAFRTSYGKTVGDHIAALRIEKAQSLLLEGEPVKSVALKSGFRSSSSFGTAFQKATGKNPVAYRDLILPAPRRYHRSA